MNANEARRTRGKRRLALIQAAVVVGAVLVAGLFASNNVAASVPESGDTGLIGNITFEVEAIPGIPEDQMVRGFLDEAGVFHFNYTVYEGTVGGLDFAIVDPGNSNLRAIYGETCEYYNEVVGLIGLCNPALGTGATSAVLQGQGQGEIDIAGHYDFYQEDVTIGRFHFQQSNGAEGRSWFLSSRNQTVEEASTAAELRDADQDERDSRGSTFIAFINESLLDTASQPSPVTTTNTVDCDGPEVELNGAFIRGGAQSGDTYGRFVHVEGLDTALVDLSESGNAEFTAWTNVGSGDAGTHSDSIPYNNAAGHTFALQVRDGTSGVVTTAFASLVPPLQCEIEAPDVDVVKLRLDDFHFSVSQAQCRSDPVAFAVVEDLPGNILSGDPTVTVYPSLSTTPILEIPITSWVTPFAGSWQYEAVLPPGAYTAYATGESLLGLVSLLDAAAFNVPTGTCVDSFEPTDLGPVLDAIGDHNTSITSLIDGLNATMQQEFLALCQKILASEGNLTALIEAIDVFIDVFINFTNANLTGNFTFNATTQNFMNSFFNGTFDLSIWNQILQNVTDHRNGTIEVNNVEYGGLEFGEFIIFLFWIIVMALAWWHGYTMLGFFALIGSAVSFLATPPITFTALVYFCLIAFTIEYFVRDGKALRRFFKSSE